MKTIRGDTAALGVMNPGGEKKKLGRIVTMSNRYRSCAHNE